MDTDARPAPDAAAWVHIRMRYEQAVETVAQIANDIGLKPHALTLRARAEGWLLRSRAKKPKPQNTRDTIKRLKELLQKRLSQLEGQLDEIGAEVSTLANERDIRATNTLVRTLEKVLELEHKDLKLRRGRARATRKFNDAERDELARRIANLQPAENLETGDKGDDAATGAGDSERLAKLGADGSTAA